MMNSRAEVVDFEKKYEDMDAYWISHPEFEDNPEDENLKRFAEELANWYSSLSTTEKRQLTQSKHAGKLLQLMTKILFCSQDEGKPKYINLVNEIRRQYEHDVRAVIKRLLKYARNRKPKQPIDVDLENDFVVLREWGALNQGYMQAEESGLNNLYQEFNKALNKAQYGREEKPESNKYKNRLSLALKKVNEGIAHPCLETEWKDTLSWYCIFISEILLGDEAYELPGKLAHALMLHVDLLRNNNRKEEAEFLQKKVEWIIHRDNTMPGLLEKGVGREHLHKAYVALGQAYQRLATDTKLPSQQRSTAQSTAAQHYFNSVRTASNVETFNHFQAIHSSRGNLPLGGICNAFTSEAILFYSRRQPHEHKTYIQKLKNPYPLWFLYP